MTEQTYSDQRNSVKTKIQINLRATGELEGTIRNVLGESLGLLEGLSSPVEVLINTGVLPPMYFGERRNQVDNSFDSEFEVLRVSQIVVFIPDEYRSELAIREHLVSIKPYFDKLVRLAIFLDNVQNYLSSDPDKTGELVENLCRDEKQRENIFGEILKEWTNSESFLFSGTSASSGCELNPDSRRRIAIYAASSAVSDESDFLVLPTTVELDGKVKHVYCPVPVTRFKSGQREVVLLYTHGYPSGFSLSAPSPFFLDNGALVIYTDDIFALSELAVGIVGLAHMIKLDELPESIKIYDTGIRLTNNSPGGNYRYVQRRLLSRIKRLYDQLLLNHVFRLCFLTGEFRAVTSSSFSNNEDKLIEIVSSQDSTNFKYYSREAKFLQWFAAAGCQSTANSTILSLEAQTWSAILNLNKDREYRLSSQEVYRINILGRLYTAAGITTLFDSDFVRSIIDDPVRDPRPYLNDFTTQFLLASRNFYKHSRRYRDLPELAIALVENLYPDLVDPLTKAVKSANDDAQTIRQRLQKYVIPSFGITESSPYDSQQLFS